MTCYDSASVDVYRRSDTFTVPSAIPNPPTPVNSDVSDSLRTNSEIPYSHGDRSFHYCVFTNTNTFPFMRF